MNITDNNIDKGILLSVIIPCYNGGKYVLEMIDCFRKQTVDYWELLIVDDGSTDDTPLMIKDYIKEDNRINFFERDREPKGGDTCRNIGFVKSSGKYVSFLDCDDLVSNTFVEHRVKFMEENPNIDYSTFIAKTFTGSSSSLPGLDDPGRVWGDGSHSKDMLAEVLKGYDYPFSVWNNIYRRTAIENIKWDENLYVYQDFDFMLAVILKGLKHKFSGLREIDYYYRQFYSKESVCSTFSNPKKVLSTLYLFNKVMATLKERELFPKYKFFFMDFILLHMDRLTSEGCIGEDLNEYIELVNKYYNCRHKMNALKRISTIKHPMLKGILHHMYCIVFFGNKRYLENLFYHITHAS